MTVGSWAEEVIADPLSDLHTVFASQHYYEPTWNSESLGRHSVDCLKIFSGHSKISGAFANKRRGVLQPRDLVLGHDLRNEAESSRTSTGTSPDWYDWLLPALTGVVFPG